MRATPVDPSLRSGFRLRGVAAALLVLLAGTACAGNSYRLQRVEDERLSRSATASLRQQLPVIGRRVDARAHRGVVTLLGEAESAAHSRLAQQAVERLGGVDRVNNLILVADSPAAAVAAPAEADSVLAARTHPAPAP